MADETNRNRGNIIGAINIKLMEKNTPKTPLWTKLQIFTAASFIVQLLELNA